MTLPNVDTVEGGKSILFLGAGFSAEALNHLGHPIKDVSGLISELLKSIGENSSEGYDLDTASQEFILDPKCGGEQELTRLIHGNFSAGTYTTAQRLVVCQPWYRIYTTNYDNVVENIFAEERKTYTEKTISDTVEPPLRGVTQLIHIYGSIRSISPNNFKEKFLLTESQRDSSPFLKSLWYRRFNDDILSASSVFFLGFSLTDIDLRRLLGALPAEALRKVHFITWHAERRPVVTRMKRFGSVHKIGTSGFADLLKKKRTGHPVSVDLEPPASMREIQYVPQATASISSNDIQSLLISGELDLSKLSQMDIDQRDGSYTLPRSSRAIKRSLTSARHDKPILVHGDIGNGKSIFANILGYHFHLSGYTVYFVRREPENIGEIISFLQAADEKIVVILDDIMKFRKLPSAIMQIGSSNILILSTVRSNVVDTSRHIISTKLNGRSFIEVDLNNSIREELLGWLRYLDENGLFGEVSQLERSERLRLIEHRCGGQMRDVILELYSRGALHQRVEELLEAVGDLDESSQKLVGMSALLTLCNFQEISSYANLAELTESSRSLEEFRSSVSKVGLPGLLAMDQGDVILRSPALAQFALLRTFGLKRTLQISKMALFYISNYLSDEREFLQLGKVLLKFSSYSFLIKTAVDGERLEKFYDDCRILKFAQNDPLFWVQRSICCMKIPNFDLADDFAKTAYGTARKLANFDTFQIDNHHARLMLTRSLSEGVSKDGVRESNASSLLQAVLSRKSDDLYHPLSVMRMFYKISEEWGDNVDDRQRKSLIFAIDESLRSISNASNLSRRFRGIPDLDKSLRVARAKLLKDT